MSTSVHSSAAAVARPRAAQRSARSPATTRPRLRAAIAVALCLAGLARAVAGPGPDVHRGIGSAVPSSILNNQKFYPPDVGSVRFWLPWQWVQTSAGEALGANPHWQVLDQAVQQALASNIQVLITFRAVSTWGTVSPSGTTALFTEPGSIPSDLLDGSGLPNAASRWKAFVQFTAQRYNALAPGLIAFEIENEPNASNFWNGSMADYVNLLAATHYWIKQVAPQAPVLAAALACDKAQIGKIAEIDPWEQAILATRSGNGGAAAPLAYDIVAVHDYFFPGHFNPPSAWAWVDDDVSGWTFSRYLQHIQGIEKAAGVTAPIWITETGFPAAGDNFPVVESTPTLQAEWLTNAFDQALALGVQRVFWLFAIDDPNGGAFEFMGLSDVNDNPRPAFTAYSRPTPLITMMNESAVFVGSALGMQQMPDQITPALNEAGGATVLFVTGIWDGAIPDPAIYVPSGGVVSRFSTLALDDPASYSTRELRYVQINPPGPQPAATPAPAIGTVVTYPYPSLYHVTAPCVMPADGILKNDNCALYNGMVGVFPVHGSHTNLVGFYVADQTEFTDGSSFNGAFYGQLCLARSTDGGNSWTKRGPTLAAEPLPATAPSKAGPTGLSQPGIIRAGGHYYAYLGFFPGGGPSAGVKVARAPVRANGNPGAWEWLTSNSPVTWQGGLPDASTALSLFSGIRGGMLGVTFNTYLQRYLMVIIEADGWYYSTLPAADLAQQDWSPPVKFFDVPAPGNWSHGNPTWENASFVTPRARTGRTGQTGSIIFSYTPSWGVATGTREFDVETFILNADGL